MLGRVFDHLWGDLDRNEIKKFTILGLTFFCIVGSYWLLRTQKDAAFAAIVGFSYQPKAKLMSWISTILVLLVYSKLVDWFKRSRLLVGLSLLYGSGFIVIGYLLADPVIGLANTAASPDRLLGWFIYPFTESFGTVMTSLFWSYVTSSTKSESAKKGYPLIIVGGQTGSIVGSFLSMNSVHFGNAALFVAGACGVLMLVPAVFAYRNFVPTQYRTNVHAGESKPRTGMLEGLKILLTRPYVLGILGLIAFYEVVLTISEFEMKMLATRTYTTAATFASFNGMYGVMTNTLSLSFALIGTSFMMRRFGLRFCLMLFPVVTGIMAFAVWCSPVLGVVTATVVIIKGLSYALNNPTREIMYMPTSRDVRFKAKGWIDQFGARSSKAVGATINNCFSGSIEHLFFFGSLISFGLIGCWIAVAYYVGTTFTRLQRITRLLISYQRCRRALVILGLIGDLYIILWIPAFAGMTKTGRS